MFTGIITDIGLIEAIIDKGDKELTICTSYDADTIQLGASIACNGVCLTVTDKGKAQGKSWFKVEVSGETLSCTTLESWREGDKINLERPLKLGDELGGHLVLGHVDSVGKVVSITPDKDSHRITFSYPETLACFIAPKGSITINGVSLTVNTVENKLFTVNIIPHTWQKTTFHSLEPGSSVNMEIDMFARYIARIGIREQGTGDRD